MNFLPAESLLGTIVFGAVLIAIGTGAVAAIGKFIIFIRRFAFLIRFCKTHS